MVFNSIHSFLSSIPSGLLGVVFIVVCIVVFVGGLIIFRKFTDKERLKSSQDAIIAFMNIVAVLYAVLLAFLVIAVWETFDKNQDNVSSEANNLGSLLRNVKLLPEPVKSDLTRELKAYEYCVVNYEWKAMEEGRASDSVKNRITAIFEIIGNYQKALEKENVVFNQIFKDFNEMLDNRRFRLIASGEGIPSVLWITLIAGTIATVFFTYYFHIEHFKTHIVFTMVIAIVIGLTLFLVFVLEHPFQDPWKVTPEPIQKVVEISG